MTIFGADHKNIDSAVQAFLEGADVKPNFDRLRECLPPKADIFMAGGAIRNIIINIIHGNAPPTRDIDLFIGGVEKDYPLEKDLAGENIQKTDLGGLRWYPSSSGYAYDISMLPKFIIIEKYRLAPTMNTLLTSIDFTVNAVIFDVVRKKLYEQGCLSSIKKRIIEFNTQRFASKLILAYRIILIRHKTDFLLSQRVFAYVKNRIDLDLLNDLKTLFIEKQGKKTAEVLIADYDHICWFRKYSDYIRQSHW